MTKETYRAVLGALANGRTINTSEDFSISVRFHSYSERNPYSLMLFPFGKYPFFTNMQLSFFMAVSQAYDSNLCIAVRHGVPVVSIY